MILAEMQVPKLAFGRENYSMEVIHMKNKSWYLEQLRNLGELFTWSIEQVPPERLALSPPPPFGEWSTLRHVFHMVYNETEIVLPRIGQWQGGPKPPGGAYEEEAAWGKIEDPSTLIETFTAVRAEQIKLIMGIDAGLLHEVRETTMGPATLKWVITKSIQHTAEHINDILRMALFWDWFDEDGNRIN